MNPDGMKEETMKSTTRVGLCLLVVGLLGTVAFAQSCPAPMGDVVLTMSGAIALENENGVLEFDMAMLQALPYTEYEVEDPWLGTQVYGGVELGILLDYVGIPADAARIVTVASDGLEVVIEAKDALYYPILIAFMSDGDEIISSMGGPIKLAFPYQIEGVEDLYAPEVWSWFVVEVRVEY